MAATAVLPTTTPVATHTATADQADAWLSWDPEQLRQVAPADARAMSKVLFARLADTEEGTREYQYVRNTLVELNITLVRFAARRFATRSEPMEDIVQVGTVGLIKAINRFDPSQDVEFPTFAMPTVIGEIKRFFRDTSWAVHVPRRLQELRLALAKATDALTYELGRTPTTAELAARLDITEAEVLEGQVAANGYSTTSIDAPTPGGDSADDDGASFAARIGEDDTRLEGVENLLALKPLLAQLTERERLLIDLRFGAELTQSQIGEQLGISQMHVSRLLSRLLAKLRTQLLPDE